ncbi:hypothetical protein OJF2_72030 [Aquisphaera giovannonii]|uniref:Uncharacterized protein n=1 Tax=Aquisphaera giovannonii TaxID=406548 RepID=A0A5B9WEE1_9BACT|nr:hypothetical protein [Aquisphaera giovannonii]QEH38599.1 hypothetical protein OJF2_72030 [Aquisphaera giovannonii]
MPRSTTPQKPHVCPRCGSRKLATILWGLPAFDDELERRLDAGEVVLGGCCVTDDDPVWECTECGWQAGKRGKAGGTGDEGHGPES